MQTSEGPVIYTCFLQSFARQRRPTYSVQVSRYRALTIRTSLLQGFHHDDAIHQYGYADTQNLENAQNNREVSEQPNSATHVATSIPSLNTYGYSPYSISEYLSIISDMLQDDNLDKSLSPKPLIFSVTGTALDIAKHYALMSQAQAFLRRSGGIKARFLIEINLSCPNIRGTSPPEYSQSELVPYLMIIQSINARLKDDAEDERIEVGIKTPPYTHQTQFEGLISALLECSSSSTDAERDLPCPIDFITATNTLGSCLLLSLIGKLKLASSDISQCYKPALNSAKGTGIGGLAGAALHPIALGNVATLRRMLDSHQSLKGIDIIGVGGVSDAAGL